MNRERAEAHLQTIEHRGKSRGARDNDLKLPLQLRYQIGLSHHFGKQAFHRQKHDAEIRRIRRIDVFVADVFGELLYSLRQSSTRPIDCCHIAQFISLLQTQIIFLRELRIDRQINRRAIS